MSWEVIEFFNCYVEVYSYGIPTYQLDFKSSVLLLATPNTIHDS